MVGGSLGAVVRRPDLSLNEWATLGVLTTQARHGYDVAAALAPGTALGDAWSLTRTKAYRALERLDALDYIVARRIEPGANAPYRTVWGPTRAGRTALVTWLGTPIEHLRDVRSAFLLKVLLRDRLGLDRAPLVAAQQAAFAPLLEALRTSAADDPVARWRHHSAEAVAAFLAELA
jgi:DNA-binding PadR family transcriptional regulator